MTFPEWKKQHWLLEVLIIMYMYCSVCFLSAKFVSIFSAFLSNRKPRAIKFIKAPFHVCENAASTRGLYERKIEDAMENAPPQPSSDKTYYREEGRMQPLSVGRNNKSCTAWIYDRVQSQPGVCVGRLPRQRSRCELYLTLWGWQSTAETKVSLLCSLTMNCHLVVLICHIHLT